MKEAELPRGMGASPAGGGAGSMKGNSGASSAVVSAAKCRRSAAELAAAARAALAELSRSVVGTMLRITLDGGIREVVQAVKVNTGVS